LLEDAGVKMGELESKEVGNGPDEVVIVEDFFLGVEMAFWVSLG
jgi:hypothetical protein